jgi:predicted phosphodiesterase
LKLGIISDIHGNLEALKVVLKSISDIYKPDYLICLGDIVGYYPHPVECINLVQKTCDIVIKGNHDAGIVSKNFEENLKWFSEEAAYPLRWTHSVLLRKQNEDQYNFLKKLRLRKELLIDKYKLLFVHGTPEKKWEYFLYPYWLDKPLEEQKIRMDDWLTRWNFVAIGHTHWAFQYKRDGRFVVNPGSVGQPRDENPKASYSVLNLSQNGLEVENVRISYDIEKVCKALKRVKLADRLCDRLYLGK